MAGDGHGVDAEAAVVRDRPDTRPQGLESIGYITVSFFPLCQGNDIVKKIQAGCHSCLAKPYHEGSETDVIHLQESGPQQHVHGTKAGPTTLAAEILVETLPSHLADNAIVGDDDRPQRHVGTGYHAGPVPVR